MLIPFSARIPPYGLAAMNCGAAWMPASTRTMSWSFSSSNTSVTNLKEQLKDAAAGLDAKVYAHYRKLTEAEIKALVVEDKWLATLDAAIHTVMHRVGDKRD
jgi:hypothetical protein